MKTNIQINERIKSRLAELGLSATDAALRAGISPTTLTRPLYNLGHRFTLSTSTLTKLCDVLECSVADFLAADQFILGVDQPTSVPISDLVSTVEGDSIRRAREERGWSQADLALRAGTYQQQVDRVERGAVRRSRLVPAIKAALGLESEPGVPEQSISPACLTDLRKQIEEIRDLLNALDLIGDGIGGDQGHSVSAVALQAKAIAENTVHQIVRMGGSSNG